MRGPPVIQFERTMANRQAQSYTCELLYASDIT